MAVTLMSLSRLRLTGSVARPGSRARVCVRATTGGPKKSTFSPMPPVDAEQLKATKQAAIERFMSIKEDASAAWSEVEDKPTAIALGFVGLFTLFTSISIIDAVDSLPFIGTFFELVGLGFSGYFAYTYVANPEGRQELVNKFEETMDQISLK